MVAILGLFDYDSKKEAGRIVMRNLYMTTKVKMILEDEQIYKKLCLELEPLSEKEPTQRQYLEGQVPEGMLLIPFRDSSGKYMIDLHVGAFVGKEKLNPDNDVPEGPGISLERAKDIAEKLEKVVPKLKISRLEKWIV